MVDPAPPQRRAAVTMSIRVVASAVMVAVLLPRIDITTLVPRTQHVTAAKWIALGLVVTLLGVALSAWRWQRVLTVLGHRVRLPGLFSHYLAGQFVGNFLPSTVGGDVLRVSRLGQHLGSSSTSFASVVLERLTGWLVLPLLILTGVAIHPGLLDHGLAPRLALGLACCTLMLLTLILLAAGNRRLGGRFAARGGWQRFIGAVHLGVDRLRHHPRGAIAVMVAAVVYQLSMVLTVFAATRAIGLDIGPAALLAFTPAVLIAQVLPLSLNGIGLREGAFVLFLTPLGATATQAVAVGLLFYGMTLVVSLLGAPAFAIGSRVARARIAAT